MVLIQVRVCAISISSVPDLHIPLVISFLRARLIHHYRTIPPIFIHSRFSRMITATGHTPAITTRTDTCAFHNYHLVQILVSNLPNLFRLNIALLSPSLIRSCCIYTFISHCYPWLSFLLTLTRRSSLPEH